MTIAVGTIHNYGGDNYVVTRVEPDHFLVLSDAGEWEDAVEFTDVVGEGETATITYVCGLESFAANYAEGQIEEGASAEQLPAEEAPQVDNELPPTAEPKG